jgi:hypothetical protein
MFLSKNNLSFFFYKNIPDIGDNKMKCARRAIWLQFAGFGNVVVKLRFAGFILDITG